MMCETSQLKLIHQSYNMFRLLLLVVLCACAVSASVKRQFVKDVLPGVGSYYFHTTPLNWTDAVQYCRDYRDSHLAYPNSQDEASIMSAMMKTYRTQYIHSGFHDQFKEGEYYTILGERVAQSCFQNWYIQTGSTDNNCGAFGAYPGLLDIPCRMKYPFICVNYNFFRKDFDYIPGQGFYKMHRTRSTWTEAQQTCEAESANLLVLNSEVELQALSNMFGHFTSWVGVHHKYINWQFVTIFDDPLLSTGFSRWAVGEPRGTNDQNPYLVVTFTSGLALKRDTDLFSFVCEQHPTVVHPPPLYNSLQTNALHTTTLL